MKLSTNEIVALEDVAARAWPAAVIERLGGWRLNAASGFSGRVNACWPLEDPGRPLTQALAEVEAWYETRGLPSRFKLVPSAFAPDDLAGALAARGYQPSTETLMMIGPCQGADDDSVRRGSGVEPSFARVFTSIVSAPGDAEERLATLGRIPLPRFLARLNVMEEPAAIGACAVEAAWAGVFAMRVDPRFRRRGLARRVLGALLADASAAGADRAWLQVEADNTGAVGLYASAGFSEAYRYQYWKRP